MNEGDEKLKILHICRQFSPSVGGLEDSVLNLARSQRQNLGVDAQVLTLDSVFGRPGKLPHRDMVDDIPVTRIAWRALHVTRLHPKCCAISVILICCMYTRSTSSLISWPGHGHFIARP